MKYESIIIVAALRVRHGSRTFTGLLSPDLRGTETAFFHCFRVDPDTNIYHYDRGRFLPHTAIKRARRVSVPVLSLDLETIQTLDRGNIPEEVETC